MNQLNMILGIISSLIVIITFLGTLFIYLHSYMKPRIKIVNLEYIDENKKLLSRYPADKYKLAWPVARKIPDYVKLGYEKAYLWEGIKRYEYQVKTMGPTGNHILMYQKIENKNIKMV